MGEGGSFTYVTQNLKLSFQARPGGPGEVPGRAGGARGGRRHAGRGNGGLRREGCASPNSKLGRRIHPNFLT